MTNLLPDMTYAEAKAKHEELKAIHSVARSLLLEMRDRKGWKALGYSSFEEYGEKEWGYSGRYLNMLATAADVQRSLGTMVPENIPERQLRPLSTIPESDRQAIWDEANRKAEEAQQKFTAKLVQDAVNEYKAENERLAGQLKVTESKVSKLEKDLSSIEEVKAKETQQQIEQEKKAQLQTIEKLKSDIDGMKKRYNDAVSKGVSDKLNEMQIEINRKQHTIDLSEKRIDELNKYKSDLEKTVGKIQRHRKGIDATKAALESLYIALFDITDDKEFDLPIDMVSEWDKCQETAESLLNMLEGITSNLSRVKELAA